MARALPETSLRRAREFDDSSHRSAGSRHSYRGDLDDSLAWWRGDDATPSDSSCDRHAFDLLVYCTSAIIDCSTPRRRTSEPS
mmetsp:Transcript_18805/g.65265  ORF Transcript_18805/g.65265 Transcript_18805/m.65265 type:complete len:83 (-) Transcript_18805:2019-2267(-)